MEKYIVYLLYSPSSNRTYTGCTNNLQRRIRQHNGEISGGAKYTQKWRPWIVLLYIENFPTQRDALQFEYRTHHPHKYLPKSIRPKRGRNYDGRIESVCSILNMEKVTLTAKNISDMPLNLVWVCEYEKPLIVEETQNTLLVKQT